MKKTHLYLLALLIAVLGASAIFYKWKVLNFPLTPNTEVDVWTLQARVEYQPRRGANKVTLQLPNVHTFRSPASWPLPTSPPVPPPTPEAVVEGPTTELVELPEARSEIIDPEQTDDGSTGPTPDEPAAEGSPPSGAGTRTATR
jgi:hypothetical protein